MAPYTTVVKFSIYLNRHVFGVRLVCICFIEILVPVFNANSVDLHQMLYKSDLGLHCLPFTLLGVSLIKIG